MWARLQTAAYVTCVQMVFTKTPITTVLNAGNMVAWPVEVLMIASFACLGMPLPMIKTLTLPNAMTATTETRMRKRSSVPTTTETVQAAMLIAMERSKNASHACQGLSLLTRKLNKLSVSLSALAGTMVQPYLVPEVKNCRLNAWNAVRTVKIASVILLFNVLHALKDSTWSLHHPLSRLVRVAKRWYLKLNIKSGFHQHSIATLPRRMTRAKGLACSTMWGMELEKHTNFVLKSLILAMLP
jgi:hypothetical protein